MKAMKTINVILLLFTLVSCANKQLDPKLIIGSWKMRDVVNNTGLDATDRVTFYENDSVYVEILVDNKAESRFKGKYKLNIENNTLTTIINETTSSCSEVVKLTATEMELKDKRTNILIRYNRL